MIGQAHLDPVWLWRWTEGRAEALATSQSAADRLSEFPAFHFVRGEAQVYQWIESENERLFTDIRRLIGEGRWHVVNGMVVQPDVNLPNGESLVRQVLLGKTYMREHLGVEPRVAYCVDSFGHPATLPQILRKCGFDDYVFMRPGPHEKQLPAEVFWWESPDGSRVLAFRIAEAYTSREEDQAAHIRASLEAMPDGLTHTMCFFGVGNHGGGPTRRQIESVLSLAQSLAANDLDIRFSHPQAYFDAIATEAAHLPELRDELQPHAIGCYSANSLLKRIHRKAECNLLVAERMAVMAEAWLGRAAPQGRLDALWWDLAFNQFHDTLAGTTTKEAAEDAINSLGRVAIGAREIIDDAGRAIAAQVDTTGPGGTVILFNPAAHVAWQYVEYEPWTDWQLWRDGRWGLFDDTGLPVAHQLVETHEALTSDHGLNRLLFRADVPAMGYRAYRFAPGPPPQGERLTTASPARAAGHVLENEALRVCLDPASGALVSCVDKVSGIEFVGSSGWNVAEVLLDESDTWSHGLRRFDEVIGSFGRARITIVDSGPLQASLLVERSYEGNEWVQQIVIRQGESELLIRNWLTWRGHWRMLKLGFDVRVADPTSSHDVPFGWIERPCDGNEVPTQMWMDVSGLMPVEDAGLSGASENRLRGGVALINAGKYGCDVFGSTMRLTVLRCPPYAFHLPHPVGSKRRYDWLDQGEQDFELLVRPHLGDWRDADVVQRAREHNMPIVPVTMHAQPGVRSRVDSLLALSSPEMEVTALKPAQDGEGYILRVADRHGRGSAGTLSWMGMSWDVHVAPFEVATWRLRRKDWGSSQSDRLETHPHDAREWTLTPCDMLERV